MTVYHAICVEDFTPNPQQDPTFVLKRGTEYTVSPPRDGKVCVFSRYWTWVPETLFVAHKPL